MPPEKRGVGPLDPALPVQRLDVMPDPDGAHGQAARELVEGWRLPGRVLDFDRNLKDFTLARG